MNFVKKSQNRGNLLRLKRINKCNLTSVTYMNDYDLDIGQCLNIKVRSYTNTVSINPQNIVYCKADGRYTRIYTKNDESIITAKVLKKFEEILPVQVFFRIHRTYLVNLSFLDDSILSKENKISLNGNTKLTVAKRRKKEFQYRLKDR